MKKLIGHAISDPPYYYDSGEAVTIAFTTDEDLLKSVLPPVLELPEGPARIVIRVVSPIRSTFGPYLGVYLGAPALLDGKPVLFGLSGIKTSFPGTIAGREAWGMALQHGDITKTWNDDVMNVVAGRNGVDFVRLSVRLESRGEPPTAYGSLAYASRRPYYDKDSTENVLVDVTRTAVPAENVQYWKGSSVVKLVGGQPGDDWSIFPVGEVVDTHYSSAGGSTTLGRGRIIAEW